MSKIGKKPIQIPAGVEVTLEGHELIVKGPKGELRKKFPETLQVRLSEGALLVAPRSEAAPDPKETGALWGLGRALARNMILGVTEGFSKSLELQGVGYKAAQKGSDLELNLGFSHPILFPIPEGMSVKIEKNVITLSGTDKESVGLVAARLRALKVPEPYKGHGVRYSDEVIKLKPGKKAVTAA